MNLIRTLLSFQYENSFEKLFNFFKTSYADILSCLITNVSLLNFYRNVRKIDQLLNCISGQSKSNILSKYQSFKGNPFVRHHFSSRASDWVSAFTTNLYILVYV